MPISLLITVFLCLLLAAAVTWRSRSRKRSAPPAEEPRRRRSRPRLGLAVSGLASEAEIKEAAAKQAADSVGAEARFAGLLTDSQPVDVTPSAEVGTAAVIRIPEVIDAPGWPQPGELDPCGDPADAGSRPIEDGQPAFEANLPVIAIADGDDAQNEARWTASSHSVEPASDWVDGASSWTAPDAPPADWGTPGGDRRPCHPGQGSRRDRSLVGRNDPA